jgi:hypothetical protein
MWLGQATPLRARGAGGPGSRQSMLRRPRPFFVAALAYGSSRERGGVPPGGGPTSWGARGGGACSACRAAAWAG